MKKFGIIGIVTAVVAIAGYMGWKVLGASSDNRASSLPSDVTMVGRIDMKKMVQEYGFTLDELKDLALSKFGEEVPETGIDYMTQIFVFSAQGYFGAILPLDNADDFKAMLEKEGMAVTEQRGLQWSVTDNNLLLAFSDDRAMLMGPAVGAEQDQLRNTLAQCLSQGESESGKQSRYYQLLTEHSEPIALSSSVGILSTYDYFSFLGKMEGLKDLDLVAGLSVKKNRVLLSVAADSENEKVKNVMGKMEKLFGEIDGALLQNTPPNPLFNLTMNVDGEKLLELLRENPDLRTKLLGLNTIFDLDMIVKSIDGDISFTYPQFNLTASGVLFQAELENDNFMKNVADWNDEMSGMAGVHFYPKDRNNASFVYDRKTYYFSTDDDRLALSDSESLARVTSYSGSEWKDIKQEMKNNCLYASLDISRLSPALNLIPYVKEFSAFERVVLSAPNTREVHLELVAPEGTDIINILKGK